MQNMHLAVDEKENAINPRPMMRIIQDKLPCNDGSY